jgi:putative serine protease PepD
VFVAVGLTGCSDGANSSNSAARPAPSVAQSSPPRSTTSRAASASTPGPLEALQQDVVNVVNFVRPSVVQIATNRALGSGIVYDANGDIVTNNHVVADAQQFQVTFFDGGQAPASLVGRDPSNDLAVIRVDAAKSNVKAAAFADSGQVETGDVALAIGNPLGLDSTVTEGIVSSTGRTVPEGNGVVLRDTVQTSAAINPGNSGGALVNINGQVIGIPTLAPTDPQLGGGAALGIGFAIPSNTVKRVADRLLAQAASGPGSSTRTMGFSRVG